MDAVNSPAQQEKYIDFLQGSFIFLGFYWSGNLPTEKMVTKKTASI